MIITVTLNPAIDKTVEISKFEIDSVNRIGSSRKDVGGKGINVSKLIKSLGGESKAIGFLAGESGNFIKTYLDSETIANDFIFTDGETRTNLKIVDKQCGTNTDINESGQSVSTEDLEKLKAMLEKNLSDNSGDEVIVVLAGSVPKGVNSKIYFELVNLARSKGAKTILDVDGELLEEGLKAKPYMIKPNNFELEKILRKEKSSTEDSMSIDEIIAGCKKFLEDGIEKVVVSLGKDGALFVSKDQIIKADGLDVDVISTVGAGDSMVAALAYGEERKLDIEEIVKLTVGVSAANVTTKGTEVASIDVINKLKEKVNFKKY